MTYHAALTLCTFVLIAFALAIVHDIFLVQR